MKGMEIAVVCAVTALWPALMELIDSRWDGRRWSWRSLVEKLMISFASALYAVGILSIFRDIGPLQTLEKYPVIIAVTVITAGLVWLMIGSRRKTVKTATPDDSAGQVETAPSPVLRARLNRQSLMPVVLIILLAVSLEATVFNFRFFQSLTFAPAESFSVSLSESIKTRDGISKIDKSIGQAEIYLTDIDQKIENIYIDIDPVNGKFTDGRDDSLIASHVVKLTILVTDEANVNAYSLPEVALADEVEGTKYIKLNLSGKVSTLTLRLNNLNDREFRIRSVILNRHVPYRFSLWRIIGVILLLILGYSIRPKSKLYQADLDFRQRWQGNTIIVTTLVLILGLVLIASTNPYFNGTISTGHRTQYEVFSEMLAKGQLYFDYEVDPKLAALENPYDPGARNNAGATYKWDHAYFNGKYYMYFGIVPELLMFLPYRLLTGTSLPTYMGINLLLILMCLGVMSLLYLISKTYFRQVRFLTYLLLSVAMILGCSVTLAKYPSVYTVPIASAVVLGIWGLYFWIRAKNALPGRKKYFFLAGSLLIALIFGCRPQVGLVFLVALPLFWDETFHQRLLFSKKGLLNTICLILPFVVVAAGLMWYNAARFGSPFDFGVNYNLTTNDMTRRGFVFDRLPLGLYAFLFQLPVVHLQFPFLSAVRLNTAFQGKSITEATFGGVLWLYPVLLAIFPGLKEKAGLKQRKIFGLFIFLVIIALLIAAVDVEVAGILNRYVCDFTWVLFAAASIAILAIAEKSVDDCRAGWIKVFLPVSFFLTVLISLLAYFVNESYSAEHALAIFYYQAVDLVDFWR